LLEKRDEVEEILSKMFPNLDKSKFNTVQESDPSGESFSESVAFIFDSGERIEAACNDWEENYRIKNNFQEGLHIMIDSKEIMSWFKDR